MGFNRKAWAQLRRDWQRRMVKYPDRSWGWKLWFYWSQVQYRPLIWYRLAQAVPWPVCGTVLHYLAWRSSIRYGLEIIGTTQIEGGVIIGHYGLIKINADRVGEDLYVFHQVTIGSVLNQGRPTIGRNVWIGAGAMVLGKIQVGDNVVIGAGAVVVHDVPSNSLVVGNPARVVKTIPDSYIADMIGYELENDA